LSGEAVAVGRLAADKLLLQSRIRQNAIQLKEKEFMLHNENVGVVRAQ
jgi:hypothetical protein